MDCKSEKDATQDTIDETPADQEGVKPPPIAETPMETNGMSEEYFGDPEYNMQHTRRGVALILNGAITAKKTFKKKNTPEKDGVTLKTTMEELGFDVRYHNEDMAEDNMKKILGDVKKENHEEVDCLFVAIMTRGNIHSKCNPYLDDEIWYDFKADLMPSLSDKPKIFLFQNYEEGDEEPDWCDEKKEKIKIPTLSNFLVIHSSTKEESQTEGSWFIQDLCKELKSHGHERDIITSLTLVVGGMANDETSGRPDEFYEKQMPVVSSTLIRELYMKKHDKARSAQLCGKSCLQEVATTTAPLGRLDDVDTNPYIDSHSTRLEVVAVTSPTDQTPEEKENYIMRHEKRGVALIFNHEFFDEVYLKNRDGTAKDCENLTNSLRALNFEVYNYNDLELSSLKQKLQDASNTDHSKFDCFLVAVMTHGEEGEILYAKDQPYKAQMVWNMFTADRVPSLTGKPKIFLFQACRGAKLDEGVWMTDSLHSSPTQRNAYSVPTTADFLIVHATMEGYYSWRNPVEGSWFIQDLCAEIKKNGRKKDFMTMMTFVLRRVSHERFSNVPMNPDLHMKKQMPVITSTLTRLIYF